MDGLHRDTQVGGEFTRRQDRLEARKCVCYLSHTGQVRNRSRMVTRQLEAHLLQRQKNPA